MPNAIRATAGKYWEIIAADLTERGWTWGLVSLLDSKGRKVFNVDAHRDDGKRYVVSSDVANGIPGVADAALPAALTLTASERHP